MKTKADEPAYSLMREMLKTDDGYIVTEASDGLTKREWFAGQIIGHIIPLTAWRTETMHSLSDVADASVKFADALIAALNEVSDREADIKADMEPKAADDKQADSLAVLRYNGTTKRKEYHE